METKSLSQMFDIEVVELDSWTRRPYQNNFFEIVYVEYGAGEQCIAGTQFHYTAGNIFLLPPLNCHSFTVNEPSKFVFIRFLDNFFLHGKPELNYNKVWFESISHILANYNRVPGDIISSRSERRYMISTINTLVSEHLARDNYSSAIVSGMMISMLNILARNIERRFTHSITQNDSRLNSILRYINNNLMDSERLKIAALADNFGISKSYFSEYFTKHAGVKLSEYILKAKLRLAETYIVHTDNSLKEIAYSLGFTDSSHLSNSFKRYYSMTIGEFRAAGGSVHRV